MTGDEVEVTLVNTNPVEARKVIVQAGTYGEHAFTELDLNGRGASPAKGQHLHVQLAAGAGGTLRLKMQRFAQQPRLAHPWDE
jgi:hypothetical protein